jgi:hypothetical protein
MEVVNELDNLRKQFNLSADDTIAWKIIAGYFSFFRTEDVQEQLWMLKVYAVISEDSTLSEKARGFISFFTDYTTLALKAVHRVYCNRE